MILRPTLETIVTAMAIGFLAFLCITFAALITIKWHRCFREGKDIFSEDIIILIIFFLAITFGLGLFYLMAIHTYFEQKYKIGEMKYDNPNM